MFSRFRSLSIRGRLALAVGLGLMLVAVGFSAYRLLKQRQWTSPGALTRGQTARGSRRTAHRRSATASKIRSGTLTLGVRTNIAGIASRDWQRRGGVETDHPRQCIRSNLELAVRQGYGALLVDMNDAARRGPAPQGAELGRPWPPKSYGWLVAATQEARRRGVDVYADVSHLRVARLGEPASSGQLDAEPQAPSSVARLLRLSGMTGVVASAGLRAVLDDRWAAGSRRRAALWIDPDADGAAVADVVIAQMRPLSTAGAADRGPAVESAASQPVATDDAVALAWAEELGDFLRVLTVGRATDAALWLALGGETMPLGLQRNLLLFAMARWGLGGVFWEVTGELGWEELHQRLELGRLVNELYQLQRPTQRDEGIANIVIASMPGTPAHEQHLQQLDQLFGAVASGLMLAGYEVMTTYGAGQPDADAYIVLFPEGEDAFPSALRPALASLLDSESPVIVYGSSWLQAPGSRRLAARLGLRTMAPHDAAVAKTVDAITLGEVELRWQLGAGRATVRPLTIISPAAVSGEVVATATVAGRPTVVVARNANKALVNTAGPLSFESGYLLSFLLRSTLGRPFSGLGSIGRRSAFLALKDTEIVVDLPVAEDSELRLIRYAADGERQPIELWRYEKPLKTSLQRHELLIVEATHGPR